MSLEVVHAAISKALQSDSCPPVQFIWHGGEPLLMGKRFFKKVLLLQAKYVHSGQSIVNSIQTNGTLLTEDWCQFFKDYGFQVGVSVDGPKILHDRNRTFASGEGSFKKVVEGIELLLKHGIPFGCLMVVTPQAAESKIVHLFEFFVDLGIRNFALIPVRPANMPPGIQRLSNNYILPDTYSRFVKSIFDTWYELDDPGIRIREISSLMRTLLGGRPEVCTLGPNCVGRFYHIGCDGEIYHCDKFVGDDEYNFGNIRDTNFETVKLSERYKNVLDQESRRRKAVTGSKWLRACGGGCMHDSYIAKKYLGDGDASARALDELIGYMHERISEDAKGWINSIDEADTVQFAG